MRTILLSRITQTNEPARCAVLLPALASLPQPLALLEVGASAGLCLIPDRYGYDYGRVRVMPRTGWDGHGPVFPCEANDAAPLSVEMPTIAWRRGLDLHPLDVCSQQDIDWLETLVWPDDIQRTERLRAAIETARADPPAIVKVTWSKPWPSPLHRHRSMLLWSYSTLVFLGMWTNQTASVWLRSSATWEPCGSAMSRRMFFQGFGASATLLAPRSFPACNRRQSARVDCFSRSGNSLVCGLNGVDIRFG